MNVQHTNNGPEGGTFTIEQGGTQMALIAYSQPAGDRISLDHTEVEDALRGQGAGRAMVAAAVEYAREKNLTIIPRCPFVAHMFEEEKGWGDVL